MYEASIRVADSSPTQSKHTLPARRCVLGFEFAPLWVIFLTHMNERTPTYRSLDSAQVLRTRMELGWQRLRACEVLSQLRALEGSAAIRMADAHAETLHFDRA